MDLLKNTNFLIPLISAIVSVSSIFISNWLGYRSQIRKLKFDEEKEIYLTLYVPLIKWMNSQSFNNKSYYWLVAFPTYTTNAQDFLTGLLLKNFEKLPVSVAMRYSEYTLNSATSLHFYRNTEYDYDYETFAKKASELFDLIIEQLLTEGTILSQKLSLPNLSKSTLENFLADKKNYIGPRFLSLETHNKPLRPERPLPF
ncbi:TPA: hypothetical protein VD638_000641 [Streptococcus pyogenes]|nr:hypothetical protein [Streptococcus pyogenes]